MKNLSMLLTAALLLVYGNVMAQKDDDVVRYNQYGVKVDRDVLRAEQRNNVLVFESKDGSYKFWFDNRVQIDGAAFWGLDKDFDKIGNNASIRRARFAVKGQITKDWYGEVDLDFANGTCELKDAIIEFSGIKNIAIKAGNFKEDFSMEQTTSSRYLAFMERPMVIKALVPSRHIGLQVEYLRDHFRASGGMFFQTVAGTEEITNVEDNNKDYGRSQGYSFTGKVGYMPYTKDRKAGLYFGVKASYRTPKTDEAVGDYGGARYSTRNSTSINRKKYLDTDVIKDVNHTVIYGLESAGYYGPFRYQTEYIANHTSALVNSYKFDGYYAQIGCLLFGGQQRFNVSEGEFTQPSRGKKWGDLELMLRHDYLTLNDKDIFGGSGQNYTVGLNFYVNNAVKFVLNYQYSDNDRYANGKGKLFVGHDVTGAPTKDYTKVAEGKGKAGVSYHMIGLRMEIDF